MAGIPQISNLSIGGIKDQEARGYLGEIPSHDWFANEEHHSLSTVALHEACENGNVYEVQEILLEGKADLDALLASHRATRTALQKASAYGHTDVVKLLLQVNVK